MGGGRKIIHGVGELSFHATAIKKGVLEPSIKVTRKCIGTHKTYVTRGFSSCCVGVRSAGLPTAEGGESSKKGFSGESRRAWRLAALIRRVFLDPAPADSGVTGGSETVVVLRKDGGGETGALTRYCSNAGGASPSLSIIPSLRPVQNSFSFSSSSVPLNATDVRRFFRPNTTLSSSLSSSESLCE